MYKNHEGYPNPTVGEAVARVTFEEEQRKTNRIKWVYIASPYRGDVELNTERARRYCYFAVRQSCLPVCPHIFVTQFLSHSDKDERKVGLYLGKQMLSRCDEVWVFGEQISEGMAVEIKTAGKLGISIRHFNTQCQEVSR